MLQKRIEGRIFGGTWAERGKGRGQKQRERECVSERERERKRKQRWTCGPGGRGKNKRDTVMDKETEMGGSLPWWAAWLKMAEFCTAP